MSGVRELHHSLSADEANGGPDADQRLECRRSPDGAASVSAHTATETTPHWDLFSNGQENPRRKGDETQQLEHAIGEKLPSIDCMAACIDMTKLFP